MTERDVTLEASEPQAELTVRRITGERYYSTVLVSTYSMTAQSSVDFVPLNNHQIVFAPGETEHTVTVEALNFDYCGSFGVRIVGDGSCQIGENDRTIVHISGEKSEPEETEPEETVPTATLFETQANTVSLDSAEDEAWDGVLGSKFYRVKDLNMWRSKMDYDWTILLSTGVRKTTEVRKTIKLGEEVIVDSGGSVCLKIDLDLGAINANVENISLDIKTKEVYSYDLTYADRSMKGGWEKSNGYNIDAPVSQNWESRTFNIGKFPTSSSSTNRYNYVIEPADYFPGDLDVVVEGCTYEFKEKYAVKTMEAEEVKTVPYFNLNTTESAEYLVNYKPPSIKLQTDDGKNIDAFYPTDEMINIVCDNNDAILHGMNLNGVVVSNHVLSDSELRRLKNSCNCSYAAYLTQDEFKISGMDLTKKITESTETYYFYPDFRTVYTKVWLESADDGETTIHSQQGDCFYTKTGSVIEGKGFAGANRVITGYAVYGLNLLLGMASPRTLISVYRHPEDSSLLGGEGSLFFVPFVPPEFTYVYIVPLTEFQDLTIKPHPSTKNETIYETVTDPETGEAVEREVTYGGRIFLNRVFGEGEDGAGQVAADEDGQIYFDSVNSNAVFTLNSLTPNGYITEWVNGTMDFDEDGIVDGEQAGGMSQSKVDSLYIPVYGNQFVYQVNQVNPKYYYRFTKFDPSRLLNGQTRVGYVKQDKRTILDYDGSEPGYKDLVPCSGAVVQIGENTAVTDENGRYEIKMDGIPDAVRVSTAIRTENGNFITHIQSNVENNISIPCYDTFEPYGVTAAYKNESPTSVRGLKVADNELTVTVKVKHEENGMYIKDALFYIVDSSGKKVLDCNEKSKEPDSSYEITYTTDETFGYATLKMNPKVDMVSGNQIYVQFMDQNGAVHRAMNLGYRFLEQLDLGTFILGAIGSSSVADTTETVVDLLGAPLFDFDMGQISGFTTTTGIIEPDAQLYENGNPVYQYDATLYSYRWASDGFGNWSNLSDDSENSDEDSDASQFNAQHGELLSKIQSGEPSKFELPEGDSANGEAQKEQQKPKGAELSNSEKTSVASKYNFELSPSVRFDMITTVRPVTAADGSVNYKHYFEEMSLGVGLTFEAASRTEISFPIGISIMIKPSLSGSVEAVYYMKTDYSGDKFWTERAIEYSADSFGLFNDFGGNMYRAGYVNLNPKVAIAAGVKAAIAEVDVNASFDFDMDFRFDNHGTATYGNMIYGVGINILILNFSVYKKKLANGTVHLFGQSKPLGDGNISLMSDRMNRAVQNAFSDGDTEVSAADRSYLAERGEWNENNPEDDAMAFSLFTLDEQTKEDHPLDRLLQNGVMPGGQMDSAMLDEDTMFVVYIDDAGTDRGANDRSCAYYTYTNEDGSWQEPAALEDDGTADSEPVIYDMGESLLIAWLTEDQTFDGAEDSLETVRQSLNALNIHAVFFDKETRTFSEIDKVTQTTDKDLSAEGSIAITSLDGGNVRIYYTKTQYRQNPSDVNELIATDSVIAYRDCIEGIWSEEMTQEEKDNILESGGNVEEYETQWYGQHFVDTRINGAWPLVTDLEADILCDSWTYFAFIADRDGSLETTGDRRVFLLFDAYDAPICVTAEEGAYDDLQFCYSGSELLLMFKTNKAKGTFDGEKKNLGGISYINLSNVFEKTTYTASFDGENGYYQMVISGVKDGESIEIPYVPEDAVILDGMVQNYTVFADSGERIYVLWNENTVNDDGTVGIQVYTSVYNGKPEWTEGAEKNIRAMGRTWSYPVLMTSPIYGSYNSFTAQSITGDGIAFVAKRTSADEEGTPQLVFHLRAPYASFVFSDQLYDTKYIYEGEPVHLTADVINTGLLAEKTEMVESGAGNTWKALPGRYLVTFESVTDGTATEIASYELETVWNVGTTISADCTWLPEEVSDNMDLRILVTDADTGEEICSTTRPIVKQTELNLGQLEILNQTKNNVSVTFTLSNSGNITASPTVVIYASDEDGEKTDLTRIQTGEILPLAATEQYIPLEIPEQYQTIEDGQGTFRLLIAILEGDEVSFSTETSGSIPYDEKAMADIATVEDFRVEQTSLKLKKGETAQLTAVLTEQEGTERNRVVYTSSDESVADVSADGTVTAVGNGKAVITAYVVPKTEWIAVLSDGSTQIKDMREAIPDSMIRSQEISVVVSSSSGGSGGSTSYTVSFDTCGGSAADSVSVNGNALLSKPQDPTREGYTFVGWFTDEKCTQPYDFSRKVTGDLTLYAKWIEGSSQTGEWENPFSDVKESDWFYNSISYVCKNNLFAGVSNTQFAPDHPMTRAMLVTVLYRAEGEPDMKNGIWGYPFRDVDAESWYGKAVYWARKNGIVNGVTEEDFDPDSDITREQIAVIMYRYAKYKGYDVSVGESTNILSYADFDEISEYAISAMQYTVGSGLMNGKTESTINPLDNATRAEVATILQRFLELNK
ncbi:MAG: S-layer homology domain-containing protein [Clostridia bacterium]